MSEADMSGSDPDNVPSGHGRKGRRGPSIGLLTPETVAPAGASRDEESHALLTEAVSLRDMAGSDPDTSRTVRWNDARARIAPRLRQAGVRTGTGACRSGR